MAFGITDSQYQALPRHERLEMWQFWAWRHEVKSRLEEKERMQARGGVSG